MASQPETLAIVLLFVLGLWRLRKWSVHWRRLHPKPVSDTKPEVDKVEVPAITPLPNFNWRKTEPRKFRPFKPKYHLTMALRKQIMDEHIEVALAALPAATPAINELYTYLTNNYLPTRFPTMFRLSDPSTKSPSTHLHNLVTSINIPLEPPSDSLQTLRILGENIDEDFMFLLPSDDGDGYALKGYVTCFPGGFNTRKKLGLKLRDVHGPVPGYKEKLEKSMDRFFEKIEVGRLVKRVNWAITTHDRLYAADGGTHLYEGEGVVEEIIDLDNTHLRCERQMLHRLPKTKALVFSFKTYLYPIKDIKEEGLGEELAKAIDGLKEGSVPAMHFYKRGVVWGKAVKEFLLD